MLGGRICMGRPARDRWGEGVAIARMVTQSPDDAQENDRYIDFLVKFSFVVDEEMGTVNVFCRFGDSNGMPDSHTFRLVDGRYRWIHTLIKRELNRQTRRRSPDSARVSITCQCILLRIDFGKNRMEGSHDYAR
jgi:hypothetical protein